MSNKKIKKDWPNKPYKTDWVLGQPTLELDRSLAMDRALLMCQLFRSEYFEDIINIINGNKDESKFKQVCAKTGTITPDQEKWLWNYLQHYDQNNNWGGTGW